MIGTTCHPDDSSLMLNRIVFATEYPILCGVVNAPAHAHVHGCKVIRMEVD